MPLETGTYISDFVVTNPVHSDGVSQGDGHERLIKSCIKNTFPNITGAVTGTQAQFNTATGAFNGAGALIASSGTVALPGVSFAADTASGLYRIGANDYGFAVAGAKVTEWTAAGFSVIGTLGSTGALTITAGGLTVSAGGAAITGNSTVTGTLSATSTLTAQNGLTVSASGAAITGNSTVTGTLNATSTLTAQSGFTVSAGPVTLPAASVATASLASDAGIVLGMLAPTAKAFEAQLLYVREEQASGTAGGGFTSGAWRQRVLNTTVINDLGGTPLAANQITLPAGTYFIEARAPAAAVNQHKAKLRNVTDATDVIIGSSSHTDSAVLTCTDAIVSGRFTLAGTKTLEIDHQCATTRASNGFGTSSGFSVNEVYTEVKIWKVG